MRLDLEFINKAKATIEDAVVPVMEAIYLHDGETYSNDFRPGLKTIEKVVSYYDFYATGISVLAKLASDGNTRALELIRKINKNTDYYRNNIYGRDVGSRECWNVPLRRLLLHMALAYERLQPILAPAERQWYIDLVNEQVPLAIEHCADFLPGEKDLHLKPVNNHTAIFMQGIYYCGKVFGRPDWTEPALEFAERYFESGHVDGYFEENTNSEREGGPSLVYTRLTAGCLYDVLDGKNHSRKKFIRAGDFYRSFLNYHFDKIPIADERTNHSGRDASYGLALHSLAGQGRFYIVDTLESIDYSQLTSETLAVLYHELDLMIYGECKLSENRIDGAYRISLPLGVVRKNGFTAGISALRALNREIAENSDYALDQQNLVYLSHKQEGVILSGIKSKNDAEYSTFRINDDAYTVRTGMLNMGDGWAEASAYYKTFTGTIRWEIGDTARLYLSADTDRTVTTSLPITDDRFVKTDSKYEIRRLSGFSPYTEGNKSDGVNSLVFQWGKELVIEFAI